MALPMANRLNPLYRTVVTYTFSLTTITTNSIAPTTMFTGAAAPLLPPLPRHCHHRCYYSVLPFNSFLQFFLHYPLFPFPPSQA
jgi:hypothetical protein